MEALSDAETPEELAVPYVLSHERKITDKPSKQAHRLIDEYQTAASLANMPAP
jgi:hypothetical protein